MIMNKFIKPKSILVVFLMAALAFSCSSDNNSDITIADDPTDDPTDDPVSIYDAELTVFEELGDMRDVMVSADGSTGALVKSRVEFTTVTENMKRLYITEEINGEAPVPFQFINADVDNKADGSLDLIGNNANRFNFEIDLPAPAVDGESIVYKFWATTGRGDFRDVTKRNAIAEDDVTALGTITVNFGTPTTDTGSGIREYAVQLDAPLGDGSSETFISLYNGKVYKISEGEETAALWDFGYFYLSGSGLASTANYPALFNFSNGMGENVSQLTDVDQAELNTFYLAPSNLDYATITVEDLNAISQPASQDERGLTIGDVLEFQDAYGNKGLIRVDEVSGTDGLGDFIRISVKVKS